MHVKQICGRTFVRELCQIRFKWAKLVEVIQKLNSYALKGNFSCKYPLMTVKYGGISLDLFTLMKKRTKKLFQLQAFTFILFNTEMCHIIFPFYNCGMYMKTLVRTLVKENFLLIKEIMNFYNFFFSYFHLHVIDLMTLMTT